MSLRLTMVVACVLMGCSPSERPAPAASFPVEEIRAAERAVIDALQADDRTAWVDHYTADAVLLDAGAPPVSGRAALLDMARTMTPLSSVSINSSHTHGDGRLAYTYGTASWVNGRAPAVGATTRVRAVIVWRKEADGRWRIAQEVFVPLEDSSAPAMPDSAR